MIYKESKKSINKCLNCTIPVQFCTGSPATCKRKYAAWKAIQDNKSQGKTRGLPVPKCPFCGRQGAKHGKYRGWQRYMCKFCGKNYRDHTTIKAAELPPRCPICGSTANPLWWGYTTTGKQKYKCRDCGKFYEVTTNRVTEDKK